MFRRISAGSKRNGLEHPLEELADELDCMLSEQWNAQMRDLLGTVTSPET